MTVVHCLKGKTALKTVAAQNGRLKWAGITCIGMTQGFVKRLQCEYEWAGSHNTLTWVLRGLSLSELSI